MCCFCTPSGRYAGVAWGVGCQVNLLRIVRRRWSRSWKAAIDGTTESCRATCWLHPGRSAEHCICTSVPAGRPILLFRALRGAPQRLPPRLGTFASWIERVRRRDYPSPIIRNFDRVDANASISAQAVLLPHRLPIHVLPPQIIGRAGRHVDTALRQTAGGDRLLLRARVESQRLLQQLLTHFG